MANSPSQSKRRIVGWLASIALAGAIVSPSWAALVAYDGFDYPANTLLVSGGVGLNGGMGWADAWDEAQAASNSTVTEAGSLAYTDALGNILTTSGGKLLNTGIDGQSQPGRTLAGRRASPASGTTVSTWVSFLGQRIGDVNADGGQFDGTYRRGANLAVFDFLGGATQSEKIDIGENTNVQFPLGDGRYEDRWQTRVPGIPAAVIVPQPYPQNPEGTPSSTAAGAQVRDAYSSAKFAELGLFVMRIDHVAGSMNATDDSGNDNVYIWMNPNLNATPSDANASIKYISADIVAAAAALPTPVAPYNGDAGEFNFDRLRLFANNMSGTIPFAQWWFDEIRVGETFADVTPHTPAVTGVPGDYNDNDVVDAADYAVWRNNPASLLNEGASPGVVNQADYDFWRARFGATSGQGASLTSAVPEPAALQLVILACSVITYLGRCRRFRPDVRLCAGCTTGATAGLSG